MTMTYRAALALSGVLVMAASAQAQVPDSAIAVTSGGVSLFRVNIDGGTLFTGTPYDGDGSGVGVPAEGSGTRMVWYPRKAAFRAGYINGTQWDAANIGNFSVAMGESVRSSGDNATAFGLRTTAANGGTFTAGIDNTATGFASVALGQMAHTNSRQGTFVFSDRSNTGDSTFASTNHSATFRVRCGMRLIFTTDGSQQVTKNGGWGGTGVAFGGPAVDGTCTNGNYLGQSGAMISTSTGAYLSTSGIWTNTSDVNRKHLFEAVSGEDVLARLRGMPIRSWSYRVDDNGIRHLGPTAQDFRAAFGLGNDDVTIGTVDADGVALAAAQALDARTATQAEEVRVLREQNAAQQSEIERLRVEQAATNARLERLEQALQASQP